VNVDRALLARLTGVRLALPGLVAGQQAGDRRSAQLGQGMEFADHRPYAPGDDLRRVDWHAYQRMRSVLVRLFHEDRNLHAALCVDASASMGFGLPKKSDHSATLAAVLALAGLRQRDRVTLTIASDSVTRRRGHQIGAFSGMLASLESIQPKGTPDLAKVLRSMTDRGRPDRLILFSDLLVEPDVREEILRALATSGRWPVLIHMLSQEELDPDLSQGVEAFDAETGEVVMVGSGPSDAQAYRAALGEFLREIRLRCSALRIWYVPATTASPIRKMVLEAVQQGRLLASVRGGRP
jgi:uncharacterized protein (DUF58 family)